MSKPMLLTTTSKAIEAANLPHDQFKALVHGLGGTTNDQPLRFSTIGKICGADTAIWCLRTLPESDLNALAKSQFLGDAFRYRIKIWKEYSKATLATLDKEAKGIEWDKHMVQVRHSAVETAITVLSERIFGESRDKLAMMLAILRAECREMNAPAFVKGYLTALMDALDIQLDFSLTGEAKGTRLKEDWVMDNLTGWAIKSDYWTIEQVLADNLALVTKHFG